MTDDKDVADSERKLSGVSRRLELFDRLRSHTRVTQLSVVTSHSLSGHVTACLVTSQAAWSHGLGQTEPCSNPQHQ